MNLDLIKNNTKWEEAANSINSNFNKTNLELTKIAASSVKHKGYFTTEAALLAAQPSPKVGDNAYVGATYPGVVYICNTAGIWTATTTVPSPPAVNISEYYKKTETDAIVATVESNINSLETDLNDLNTKYVDHLIPLFTNLMDGVSVTTGYYINTSDTPTVMDGAGYTDYIPVVPGKQYRHYAFQYYTKGIYYDANKERLYDIMGSDSLEEKIYTTPDGVYFVRLNIRTSDSGMYLIENNDSALKYYLDFLRLNPNDPVLPEIIGGQPTEWTNLISGVGIYKSGYYLSLEGNEISNSEISITNKIDVIGGAKYRRLNQSFAYDGAFYDANDNFISGITGQDITVEANVEVIAPSNSKYVKLNVFNTQNISAVFCSEDDYYKVNKYNLPWLYIPPVTIDQGDPAGKTYIGTRDINTFVGATNHVIDLLITAKPTAKFIFITHFTEDGAESNRGLKTLIDTQMKIAQYWGVKCIDLAHLVRATKKDNKTNTLIIFAPDELHPGVRHDLWSVNEIANHIYSEIKDLYPSWTNKKIAWYGTSIPAGHDLYTTESQYPKILATLLGCVTDNYSQAGGSIRRAKSDGTLLSYSFLDVNNTANYQTKMLDLIGTANEPDIFIFDYGINDWHHDSSDFENVDY